LEVADLVFIDETGINTSMTRLYGGAPKGQRAVGKVPRNHGENLSIIGAISLNGLITSMAINGAVDGAVFNCFIEHFLVPNLRQGQTIIMDNLSLHLSQKVEKLITAAKACIIYLPPYSPDLSPIENFWSKVKTFLRARGARTKTKLLNALAQAFDSVSPNDILGWFRLCGYKAATI
jgi:transposase